MGGGTADLKEYGRVFLVQFDQLKVGYGVDDPHGCSSHCHGNGQSHNPVTERDHGKHHRDKQGGDSQC